nr:hypothetical protein B0A51_07942 [Rachicladosporium sp. CCFEE 5018]OQO28178.1 hypothetical protein B0A51_04598 [Rachicladosporium sp. CCFEE 5018]
MAPRPLRALCPAAPKRLPPPPTHRPTTFYDLPPELRVEIYKLALLNTHLHILAEPSASQPPHSLTLTTKQIRLEVLPLLHSTCPITASITDFDFTPLLTWLRTMPPDQETNLCKNDRLTVILKTTINEKKEKTSNSSRNSSALKRWLHLRADRYRAQPGWVYEGRTPDGRTSSDLKRKYKRAAVEGEKRELGVMLRAVGIPVVEGSRFRDDSAEGGSEG